MIDVRLTFSKKERAMFISHLDLMRVFTRALARADIPVWYTQGFNPHIYLTFALPLSLGCESDVETVDFRLLEEMDESLLIDRLNAVLPLDIRVLKAQSPKHKADEIRFAAYEFVYESRTVSDIYRRYQDFLKNPIIPVTKKTKKSEKELNLKDYFFPQESILSDDALTISFRLTSGIQENMSVTLFANTLEEYLALPDDCYLHMKRTAVLLEDLSNFAD